MTHKTNIFGDKICTKSDCPAWVSMIDGDGIEFDKSFCRANLDFYGRIGLVDGKLEFGTLCKLPPEYMIVDDTDKPEDKKYYMCTFRRFGDNISTYVVRLIDCHPIEYCANNNTILTCHIEITKEQYEEYHSNKITSF